MHEHDHEIIMALAEGSLDPEAATRAMGEIGGCLECSRELEMQRIALDALAGAPAVYLSATESAGLRDRLHRELGVVSPKPSSSRSSVAWGRWTGFALGTAAVFLVALFILPSVFVGGDDDAAETVAFEETAEDMADGGGNRAETTAAAAVPSAEAPQVATDDLAGSAEMAAEPTTTMAAAETTAAPETTEAPAGDADALAYVVPGPLSEELLAEIIDQLTFDADFFRAEDEAVKALNPDWAACLESPAVFDIIPSGATAQIVGTLVDETAQESLLAAFVMPDPAETTLVAIALPDCVVVETLP